MNVRRDDFGKRVHKGLIAGTDITVNLLPDGEVRYCNYCCMGCPKEMKAKANCYFQTVDVLGKKYTWYTCNRQHAQELHIHVSAKNLCTCDSYICYTRCYLERSNNHAQR